MNLKNRSNGHMTDLVFTLSLFCMFAVSAFFVVMIGVHVYQRSVLNMEDTYSTRTALAYVTEKIRQHDAFGQVELGDLEGDEALVLKDVINGDTYLTYIYPDEKSLYELSVKEGTPVSKDMGDKILDVKDFTITETEDGFFEFTASSRDGSSFRLIFHMRNQESLSKNSDSYIKNLEALSERTAS